MDDLILRSVYGVLNNIPLTKKKYVPQTSESLEILPYIGWIVTIKSEKENTAPEGLGSIKETQEVRFLNPNSPKPWTPKEWKAFSGRADLKHAFYLTKQSTVTQDQNKFNEVVDSFLAEQQLQGKFKF